ncbi:hypothetical protein [Geoglobus acetivorans]|uniref:Uncharacterized protein n=1 Tax=Geoglobus acetivorans TaxID=565033 RepID=A0ABZ3H2E1_GEOAI|nr:hypothetical protein [Geoglobus acetivorans]
MEALVSPDLKVDDREFSRFCPVMKRKCLRELCMWFLSDRICAISRIAIRLDAFVEGVPVVQLWRDE